MQSLWTPGRRAILGAATVILLAWSSLAAATNGYFAHGYSAQQRGMAGAGAALGGDAFVGSINPALLVRAGDRLDFNLTLFHPERDFTVADGPDLEAVGGAGLFQIDQFDEHGRRATRVRSENELFFIPGIAYSRRIDEDSSWGITFYGNGGMNTEYRRGLATFAAGVGVAGVGLEQTCGGAFGGGDRVSGNAPLNLCGGEAADPGVDLIQVFLVPTYARSFGPLSLGISPIVAGQRFRATGLSAFARFSESPDKVSDNGTDLSYGAGVRGGFTLEVTDWLRIGGSYQSRIDMTEFDEYKGLFADQGDFDIPSNFNGGIAVSLGRSRLAIDYQRINYNEVKAVGDAFGPNQFVNGCARPVLLAQLVPLVGNLVAPPVDASTCLGGDNGPGFGWQDVTVYKFGYEYHADTVVLRLGFSNNTQPIRSDEVLFNTLAPAVPEHHYTAGLTWQWSQRLGLDLALMYADNNPVRGRNPLSHVEGGLASLLAGGDNFGTDPRDQTLVQDMRQFELTLGINYRFGG